MGRQPPQSSCKGHGCERLPLIQDLEKASKDDVCAESLSLGTREEQNSKQINRTDASSEVRNVLAYTRKKRPASLRHKPNCKVRNEVMNQGRKRNTFKALKVLGR